VTKTAWQRGELVLVTLPAARGVPRGCAGRSSPHPQTVSGGVWEGLIAPGAFPRQKPHHSEDIVWHDTLLSGTDQGSLLTANLLGPRAIYLHISTFKRN